MGGFSFRGNPIKMSVMEGCWAYRRVFVCERVRWDTRTFRMARLSKGAWHFFLAHPATAEVHHSNLCSLP